MMRKRNHSPLQPRQRLPLLARYLDAYRQYQAALERRECDDWGKVESARPPGHAAIGDLYQQLADISRRWTLYLSLRPTLDVLAPSVRPVCSPIKGLSTAVGDPGKALETYREAQRLYAQERHRDGEIRVLKKYGIAHGSTQPVWPMRRVAIRSGCDR